MKTLLYSCLLSAIASTSFAAAPQYKARTDIITGYKLLYGMAVADFNGDGKPDIAATDDYAKNVYVYLNDGNGGFGAPKTIPITMTALGPGKIVAGDFNEDGKQDIIVGTVAGLQADILLTGNGDGTFTQQQTLPNSYGFESAAVADINQDQHLDLVFGGNGSIVVYLGDGHGGFQQKAFSNQGNSGLFTGVVTADFNKDSKLDLVVASPIQTAGVRYYSGSGDGTFSSPTMLTTGSLPQPRSVATADFNADGNPDLLIGSTYIAAMLPGNGDGTFNTANVSYLSTPIGTNNPNAYAPLVAAVDIDGDKKVDAVVADDYSRTINVFLNDGTGKFLQSNPDFSAVIDSGVAELAVADLNGDGIPDLVVASNITQNISVFLSIKPKLSPVITLSSSSPSTFATSSISMTAKIAGSSGIAPTGIVTLMDGSTAVGVQALDTNGQAIFTLSNLSVGVHPFTAVYAGDTNYNSVTSDFVSPIVTDMHIASTTASQTVTAGASASYSFTVIPDAGLTGTVTFTCSQLPSLATCDPVTVTLNGRPVDTTLTVRTTAPLRSQNSTSHYALALLPLFAVCCVRRRLLTPLLGITLICTLGFFATGCSSSKSSTTTPGTPSGSTQFTVTASITTGGQTLTRSTTATLVVQ